RPHHRRSHGFRASFRASLLRRLGAALRRQHGGNDRLVRVHVGNGRDADAPRLDDVDGVDADADAYISPAWYAAKRATGKVVRSRCGHAKAAPMSARATPP